MKIVFVDTTLPGPVIGGAQTFLPGLLRGLHERGHEVHLVSNGIPDKRVAQPIAEGFVALHTQLWKNNILVEDAARTFAQWVNKLQPDIYVVSVSWEIGWLALPHIASTIATFTIAHSNNDAFYFPARHYKRFLTKAIGVSHEICNKYTSIAGILPEAVHWIPYGIRAAVSLPARISENVLNLIFVGRLEEPDKRISDVVLIIKKLEEVKRNYKFRIIGDGSRFAHIKNELSTEIQSERVLLTGWLESDEVLNLLQQSDVFILTSSSEGFSISLIEAMANGCCPVVTDIPSGSVQLIENNTNGYLLAVGDIDGFADKLRYLAKHPEILAAMRKSAWETGKPYSIDKMVDSYLDYFEKGIEAAIANPRQPVADFPIMESCRSGYPRWLRVLKIKINALLKKV